MLMKRRWLRNFANDAGREQVAAGMWCLHEESVEWRRMGEPGPGIVEPGGRRR
jgi:hypothetical protein